MDESGICSGPSIYGNRGILNVLYYLRKLQNIQNSLLSLEWHLFKTINLWTSGSFECFVLLKKTTKHSKFPAILRMRVAFVQDHLSMEIGTFRLFSVAFVQDHQSMEIGTFRLFSLDVLLSLVVKMDESGICSGPSIYGNRGVLNVLYYLRKQQNIQNSLLSLVVKMDESGICSRPSIYGNRGVLNVLYYLRKLQNIQNSLLSLVTQTSLVVLLSLGTFYIKNASNKTKFNDNI
ncbi:hypothetical protein AGLY_011180 [Aphis glycines]|uniref:Uncharacterized protein n=1 Tax=Aphis glycines TaxID=307491 RepID=A0A6G0TDB2_APHGL|nr:hypothetical protein AGLY_011180 [Aphis glycines]